MPIDEQTNKEIIVVKEKKSKKKIVGVISTIVVLVPIIIALLYMTNSPIIPQLISANDFPVERFSQGFDILCNKYPDQSLACLIKKDGRVDLTLGNGIYKFQTRDYSLMKGYWSDIGEEEKSISYAFKADGVSVRVIDGANFSMWLLTPTGKQIDQNYPDI